MIQTSSNSVLITSVLSTTARKIIVCVLDAQLHLKGSHQTVNRYNNQASKCIAVENNATSSVGKKGAKWRFLKLPLYGQNGNDFPTIQRQYDIINILVAPTALDSITNLIAEVLDSLKIHRSFTILIVANNKK